MPHWSAQRRCHGSKGKVCTGSQPEIQATVMQHHLPLEGLGPTGPGMAGAIQACVHCGFCLSACPTYQVLGNDMDSPRGRIYLMKSVLEGQAKLDEVIDHVDRCLGCLACETACPSGVVYRDLISPFREY